MRVFIIDDDETALRVAKRRFEVRGHVVEARSEAIGTTNAVRRFKPDAVVLDLSMPAMSGEQLARLLKDSGLSAKLVIFSAAPPDELAVRAAEVGAAAVVSKSEGAELVARVEALVGG